MGMPLKKLSAALVVFGLLALGWGPDRAADANDSGGSEGQDHISNWNGIAATLEEVVRHYETHLGFIFTDAERADLVAFLKAL
jgi:hypothetical protein